MSSANNSSKSGSKSCMEEINGEEDLVTWLQYPLEDAIDKSYCSGIMEQWPQAFNMSRSPVTSTAELNTSKPMPGTTASMVPFANYLNMNNASSLFRSKSPNSASMDMITSSSAAKEARAVSESIFKPMDAQGALAMGARRAAGLSLNFGGFENLNRVKTSMQPQSRSSQAIAFPSSKAPSTYAPQNESTMKSCPMATTGADLSNNTLASQPMHGSFRNIPNISWPMFKQVSIHPSEIAPSRPSGSTLLSPDSFKRSVEKHMSSPATAQQQQSGCSHVTEEATIRSSSDHSNGSTSKGRLCATQPSSSMLQGVKTVFGGTQGHKLAFGGSVSEMAPASCSGGSQASADLTPRGTEQNAKRKAAEDSECQSEDADGESLETKQPSKPKRNRAAEVHNLSERNRRNRINEKLRALQDLIPNSCKTDKASILDEAIEYMKTLQMQLQMVSMRNGLSTVSPMMIPIGMPQHLQMGPVPTIGLGVPIGHAGMGMGMGMGMGLGMGMGMGMNMGHMDFSNTVIGRPLQPVPAPVTHLAKPFHDANLPVSTQETSQSFSCIDSEVVQIPQNSSQLPVDQAQPVSQNMLYSFLHQQNEQGQDIPHNSLDHGVGQ